MEDSISRISSQIQSIWLNYRIQDRFLYSTTFSSNRITRMKLFHLPSTRGGSRIHVFFLSKQIKWEEYIWKILRLVLLYACLRAILNHRNTIIPFYTSFHAISQSIVLLTIRANVLRQSSSNLQSYRWHQLFKSKQVGRIRLDEFPPYSHGFILDLL